MKLGGLFIINYFLSISSVADLMANKSNLMPSSAESHINCLKPMFFIKEKSFNKLRWTHFCFSLYKLMLF